MATRTGPEMQLEKVRKKAPGDFGVPPLTPMHLNVGCTGSADSSDPPHVSSMAMAVSHDSQL